MKKLKCKKLSFIYQALIYIFYVDIMLMPQYCSLGGSSFNFFSNALWSSYSKLKPWFIKSLQPVPDLIELPT